MGVPSASKSPSALSARALQARALGLENKKGSYKSNKINTKHFPSYFLVKNKMENYCSIKRCTTGASKRLVKNRKGNYSTTNIQAI